MKSYRGGAPYLSCSLLLLLAYLHQDRISQHLPSVTKRSKGLWNGNSFNKDKEAKTHLQQNSLFFAEIVYFWICLVWVQFHLRQAFSQNDAEC